jgi:hypothetical protein
MKLTNQGLNLIAETAQSVNTVDVSGNCGGKFPGYRCFSDLPDICHFRQGTVGEGENGRLYFDADNHHRVIYIGDTFYRVTPTIWKAAKAA